MGKVETITPVHIFSGQKFLGIKKDNYLYSIDKLIELYPPSYQNLRKLASINNPTQNDLIHILSFDLTKLDPQDAISMNKYYAKYASNIGNVSQMTTYFHLPYIPASSLKGAFVNVFWYHLINSNDKIKNYLMKQEDLNQTIKNIDEKIKQLRSYLIINDIKFEQEAIIYNVKRYDRFKTLGFNDNVETIDQNIIKSCNIIKDLTEKEKKLLKNLKEELLNKNTDNIIQEIIEELYNYIIDFKILFPKINKEYMKIVLIKEQSFIHNLQNKNIDLDYLKQFYKELIEQLDNGNIIMQIGRFTNYVNKSFQVAFGEFYEKNFTTLLKLNKTKKVSTIDTMSLVTIDQIGKYPLGFIKVEF